MSSAEEIHVPSLQRSKTFAMLALIMAVVAWVVLMITAHFLPEYNGSFIFLCWVLKQAWSVVWQTGMP